MDRFKKVQVAGLPLGLYLLCLALTVGCMYAGVIPQKMIPALLVLMVLGAVKMMGNPFFTQLRPGRKEKIFRLLKFRTMTCEKDKNGTQKCNCNKFYLIAGFDIHNAPYKRQKSI